VLLCEGAPRDLGTDQGLALREAIRSACRLEPGWVERRLAREVARDVARFYPQLAERTAGLARGAGIRRLRAARLLARELALPSERGSGGSPEKTTAGALRVAGGVAFGVTGSKSRSGPLLARSFELPREAPSRLELRCSRPEGGYASVEVIVPELVAGLAGVNERGLAALATSVPSPEEDARPRCPAVLLVQECLQRFDTADAAVEWCLARPAGGRASVLLADASGALAGVLVRGPRRTVHAPDADVLLGVGRLDARTDLEKRLAREAPLGAEDALGVFAWHGEEGRAGDATLCRHGGQRATAGVVVLEPATASLRLVQGPPCRSRPAAARRLSL